MDRGEFGEVTVIIGLVINFLAVGTLLLNSRDTLSYRYIDKRIFKALRRIQIRNIFLLLIINPFNGPREVCLLYTSPSPRDQRGSRMPSSA